MHTCHIVNRAMNDNPARLPTSMMLNIRPCDSHGDRFGLDQSPLSWDPSIKELGSSSVTQH